MTKITAVTVRDIRFPTSRNLDGSDAMNPDPDYSAAYVVLKTDQPGLEGHGLTFTLGLGTELCVAAAKALAPAVIGRNPRRHHRRHGQVLAQPHRVPPAALGRAGEGRAAPRDRRGGERDLGSVGQGTWASRCGAWWPTSRPRNSCG